MVCTLPILLQQPSCDDFRLCLICSVVLSATLRPKSGGDLVYRLPLNFWIDTSCGLARDPETRYGIAEPIMLLYRQWCA